MGGKNSEGYQKSLIEPVRPDQVMIDTLYTQQFIHIFKYMHINEYLYLCLHIYMHSSNHVFIYTFICICM
jgi:hypothetical protein